MLPGNDNEKIIVSLHEEGCEEGAGEGRFVLAGTGD
jgi:hypothetical protein